MYGLVVKLTAIHNRRADLITVMGGADSHKIPGCLSFIVASDADDPDVLWITEVWTSQADHQASLQQPAHNSPGMAGKTTVDNLIAEYERVATTLPVVGSSHPLHGERAR